MSTDCAALGLSLSGRCSARCVASGRPLVQRGARSRVATVATECIASVPAPLLASPRARRPHDRGAPPVRAPAAGRQILAEARRRIAVAALERRLAQPLLHAPRWTGTAPAANGTRAPPPRGNCAVRPRAKLGARWTGQARKPCEPDLSLSKHRKNKVFSDRRPALKMAARWCHRRPASPSRRQRGSAGLQPGRQAARPSPAGRGHLV